MRKSERMLPQQPKWQPFPAVTPQRPEAKEKLPLGECGSSRNEAAKSATNASMPIVAASGNAD